MRTMVSREKQFLILSTFGLLFVVLLINSIDQQKRRSVTLKSTSIPIAEVDEKLVGNMFTYFHRELKHLEFESLKNDDQDSRHPLPSMVDILSTTPFAMRS